jgi:hypothetical protein
MCDFTLVFSEDHIGDALQVELLLHFVYFLARADYRFLELEFPAVQREGTIRYFIYVRELALYWHFNYSDFYFQDI